MDPVPEIRSLAAVLRDLRLHQLAQRLEVAALKVARGELMLDEMTREAIEDEQLRARAVETAVVVRFPVTTIQHKG